ncbi:MMPL family transporter [Herbaspirillum sp. RTI4]|nr:MMPL family transporter [Herbaspirillum sp. RTI4]MDY7578926.1 MMPL family transporter [Herbaspirillum sp. RTI4]MEA9982015.1 MMPL family transporter [Herbaspirillum sp. RTI4]
MNKLRNKLRNKLHKKLRGLPLLWLLVVSLLLGHNASLWLGQRNGPDTNILALLPSGQQDPVLQQAFRQMVDAAQQRMVVLIGADDWPQAARAADAYDAVIRQHPAVLQSPGDIGQQVQNDWLKTFTPARLRLLTPAQRSALQTAPPSQWVETALSGLYGAFSGPKLGSWQDDPFGLFSGWVQERAQETPVRPRDGKLFVESKGRSYAVVLMTVQQAAFSMAAQDTVLPVLADAAKAARQSAPDVEIVQAGILLHAAAASRQASHEMSTIGIGSLIGILLMMWCSFRSLKPIALIALSLLVGCLGALSVSWLVFGKIHLLTLVFGASLIGIAQDYSIYFLCARLGTPATLSSPRLMRQLVPGLGLMLAAALIGYFGLALTPFPGIQQMAVFSSAGLVFAWLTTVCWLPWLVRADSFQTTALADRYSLSLRHWPVLRWHWKTMAAAVLLVALAIAGLSRLTVSDDIRALQTPNKVLLADQLKLGKLLDAPTPVQFYLVQAASADAVLAQEELLKQQLAPLIDEHIISGYQAISNWVPSSGVQKANRALVERTLLATGGPLTAVAKAIGEEPAWAEKLRQHLLQQTSLLTPDDFLKSPAGEPWRHLWLGKTSKGYASIVALRGLNDYRNLPRLAQLAQSPPLTLLTPSAQTGSSVLWMDKASEISSVLSYYRQTMSWGIVGAYLAIYLLLLLRYRRAAWRVIAPPALASLGVIALFGWCGIPLQLFHVLACLLILGLGVDYGIFLQEPADRQRRFAWLTVGLSALSALFSFGLLALSGSPPLHAFGLTMLLGMAAIWGLAPCFSLPLLTPENKDQHHVPH